MQTSPRLKARNSISDLHSHLATQAGRRDGAHLDLLAALRLIDEFRKQIFQIVRLPKGSTIHTFTEVDFLLHKKQRVDGLFVVVRGRKIINAILIEVKNKNIELGSDQIENYAAIAKDYGIPTILTISNQFVSFPTQSLSRSKCQEQCRTTICLGHIFLRSPTFFCTTMIRT